MSPSQSHHVRADGGLVDKHQPGRIKHTLLSYPAAARSRHICSLPTQRHSQKSCKQPNWGDHFIVTQSGHEVCRLVNPVPVISSRTCRSLSPFGIL